MDTITTNLSMTKVHNDWEEILIEEMQQRYYKTLMSKLEAVYAERTVYPPAHRVFRALELTPYADVKVVILGQDPYHGAGQAHGLSFSVLPGVKLPPSLRNIYKELQDDIGCPPPAHGCLAHWARQGVLLLNSVLTVEEGQANAHRKLGWETFTDKLIGALNERERPIAFVLWGKQAQDKGRYIDRSRHLVIEEVHPSPLSAYAGFFGSRPFTKCNAFLRQHGIPEIDWIIPELEEEER
ncbi:uracil-DNA glycosylase [Cohnella panacarvi]|uniref:uracil-DNA glycosylase n=1 Tax=Cohnella panacarvi TaxID=400776 RepID=UPI00047A5A59|nr:uracil-DNA glycosylase [Cohnella panacarvi]